MREKRIAFARFAITTILFIIALQYYGKTVELKQDIISLKNTMRLHQEKIQGIKLELHVALSDNDNLITENKKLTVEVGKNKDTAKVLQAIMQCESGFDPKALNKNGTHSIDIGLFQINDRYHYATAKKMGLDIYDTVDNVRYGLYLFEKEGVKPWKASTRCINKIMAKK